VDDGGEWTPERDGAHISYARSQKCRRRATSPPTLSSSSNGTLDHLIAADLLTHVDPLDDEMLAALGLFVGLARVLVALLRHMVQRISGSAIAAACGLLLLGKKCRYGMSDENLTCCCYGIPWARARPMGNPPWHRFWFEAVRRGRFMCPSPCQLVKTG
jgi:hypothetical protein